MDEGASEEKAKRWLQDQYYGKTATATLFLELRQLLASTGRLHLPLPFFLQVAWTACLGSSDAVAPL